MTPTTMSISCCTTKLLGAAAARQVLMGVKPYGHDQQQATKLMHTSMASLSSITAADPLACYAVLASATPTHNIIAVDTLINIAQCACNEVMKTRALCRCAGTKSITKLGMECVHFSGSVELSHLNSELRHFQAVTVNLAFNMHLQQTGQSLCLHVTRVSLSGYPARS